MVVVKGKQSSSVVQECLKDALLEVSASQWQCFQKEEGVAVAVTKLFKKWNDSVEHIFTNQSSQSQLQNLNLDEFEPQQQEGDEEDNNNNKSIVSSRYISIQLSQLLLDAILNEEEEDDHRCATTAAHVVDDDDDEANDDDKRKERAIVKQANTVLEQRKNTNKEEATKADSIHNANTLNLNNPAKALLFYEIVRTNKNWLRWYLQFEYKEDNEDNDSDNTLCIYVSHSMMKLYLQLTMRCLVRGEILLARTTCTTTDNENSSRDDLPRQVSQLFFYSTFYYSNYTTTSNNNNTSKTSQFNDYFVKELNIGPTLLKLLVISQNPNFILSVGRSIHNLVVSYPQQSAAKYIKETRLSILKLREEMGLDFEDIELAPWVVGNDVVTYEPVLCNCILWALHVEANNNNNNNDLGRFPGGSAKDDHRCEMAIELLRVLYALQTGSMLQQRQQGTPPPDDASSSSTLDNTERLLFQLVFDILELENDNGDTTSDSSSNNNNNSIHKRTLECQLALIPLLTDAKPSFATALVEERESCCVRTLLYILEHQVNAAFDSNNTNNFNPSSAASLMPILVVLHKFCSSSPKFCKVVKEYVFPPERDVILKQKASEYQGKKKNMVPLDAPVGTLRCKICQLLTCPESHVKRFTGELVWVLCNADAQEYVQRVGMGNAMPILHSKGIVQLPNQVYKNSS